MARPRDYLLSNLLALPGIGTFMAGQRVSGIAQMILAVSGFVFTLYWFVAFAHQWVSTRQFPLDGGPQFRWGLVGVGLFGTAWCWGLISGLQILRKARTKNS